MAPSTPLVDPSSYFRRHDRPSLTVAAGIVFAQAVATAVALWLFLQRVIAHVEVPPEEKARAQGVIGGAIFGIFVVIFLGWLPSPRSCTCSSGSPAVTADSGRSRSPARPTWQGSSCYH